MPTWTRLVANDNETFFLRLQFVLLEGHRPDSQNHPDQISKFSSLDLREKVCEDSPNQGLVLLQVLPLFPEGVVDLGVGNGILGIGALLLGAPRAVFVEAQGCVVVVILILTLCRPPRLAGDQHPCFCNVKEHVQTFGRINWRVPELTPKTPGPVASADLNSGSGGSCSS